MIAIRISELNKTYKVGKKGNLRDSLSGIFNRSETKEFFALKNINLDIQQGETIGIIGPNGAGKSTLLKIISRITAPTSGEILIKGRLASLLEVGTGFHPELSGIENIYLNGSLLGMSKADIRKSIDQIIDFSGINNFIDLPVKRLSSGMYVRLAFSVAAHLRSDILIVDEVLSVGDHEFQKKSLSKMTDLSKSGKTLIFVSHDLSTIRSLCQKTVLLQNGEITYVGSTQATIDKYLGSSCESYKEFHEYGLKYVKIHTIGNLAIEVGLQNPSFVPIFGFVIHDRNGIKVFGTNTTIENFILSRNTDGLRIDINEPVFLNGRYTLSIWYGSIDKHFIVDEHSIHFFIRKKDTYSHLGFIKPRVKIQTI